MAIAIFACLLFFFFLLHFTLDLDLHWIHPIPSQLAELSRLFGMAFGDWGTGNR
jgi:hypothetical protein